MDLVFQLQKDIQSMEEMLLVIIQSSKLCYEYIYIILISLSVGQSPQNCFVLQISCWTELLTDVDVAAESYSPLHALICLMR